MCTANIDAILYNGARGVVVGVGEAGPRVRWNCGRTQVMGRHVWNLDCYDGTYEAEYEQVPVNLAWATTIHSAQGMTLDRVVTSLGAGIWEDGHAYVAVSRVRSLDGLSLKDIDEWRIKAPEVPPGMG